MPHRVNTVLEALQEHVANVEPFLREVRIDGDGNCLFRAVAWQTPTGEDSHGELRQLSVDHVEAHAAVYSEFAVDVPNWVKEMRKDRAWGDNTALKAIEHFMRPTREPPTPRTKGRVLRAQDWKCGRCGEGLGAGEGAEIDHITPLCRGGAEDFSNLQALCSVCHQLKTTKENETGFAWAPFTSTFNKSAYTQ